MALPQCQTAKFHPPLCQILKRCGVRFSFQRTKSWICVSVSNSNAEVGGLHGYEEESEKRKLRLGN